MMFSFEEISKIIVIQRWWRNILKNRHKNLNPIIFDDDEVEANHVTPVDNDKNE